MQDFFNIIELWGYQKKTKEFGTLVTDPMAIPEQRKTSINNILKLTLASQHIIDKLEIMNMDGLNLQELKANLLNLNDIF